MWATVSGSPAGLGANLVQLASIASWSPPADALIKELLPQYVKEAERWQADIEAGPSAAELAARFPALQRERQGRLMLLNLTGESVPAAFARVQADEADWHRQHGVAAAAAEPARAPALAPWDGVVNGKTLLFTGMNKQDRILLAQLNRLGARVTEKKGKGDFDIVVFGTQGAGSKSYNAGVKAGLPVISVQALRRRLAELEGGAGAGDENDDPNAHAARFPGYGDAPQPRRKRTLVIDSDDNDE